MINKEEAFQIAKNIIPDIEIKGVRVSDQLSSNSKLKNLPKDCWYISYSQVPINNLSCSNLKIIFMCIGKMNGEVLYHNVI